MLHISRNWRGGVIVSTIFLLVGALTSFASMPGDQHWDNQFGPIGTDFQIYAAATVGRTIYVGGIFYSAGNAKARCVAGYDGTNWFPLNNGPIATPNSLADVFAMASDGTNVYAGGIFTNMDDCGAANIARWDGASWWPLGGTMSNALIYGIKIYGTNLFVGGVIGTNANVAFNGIARWDGSNWNPVGSGVSGGSQPVVLDMEYDGTNLYAGGTFIQAGGSAANNIAAWNGSSWSALGNGLPGTVQALARFNGYLYAGGSFTNAALQITNFAKWDGTAWSSVANANATVGALLTDGTNLYVGGSFTNIGGFSANRIARWDGKNWSALGAAGFGVGVSTSVYKMTFDYRHRLVAVGNFNQVNGLGASDVALWDGTNWFPLGATTCKGMTRASAQVQGLYHDGTNLYAGGLFTEAGDVIVNGLAKWDGTNWFALGSVAAGQPPAASAHAFVEAGGYLIAGGSFTNLGGTAAARIAEWDGSNWYNVGDADSQVRTLSYDGTHVWAGGSFTNIGGMVSTGLAILTVGHGWSSFGVVAGGSRTVNALAWDGTYMYVGGSFTSIGGVSTPNIARYDGSTWTTLGSGGMNGTVNALAVSNGVLYAGGSFSIAGGSSISYVAKWNGSGWSALGTGLNSSVSSLAVIGKNLYAGGSFTNSGSLALPGIAKWDGTNWTGLGSGLFVNNVNLPGTAVAMAVNGNDLYVGGTISLAGDKPSSFIAHWNDQSNFYASPHPKLNYRAQTNGLFQFRLTGTSGENYVLQASTNLITWKPLMTNSSTFYDFTDTTATNYPHRYYRAVLNQ